MEPKVTDRVDTVSKAGASKQREVLYGCVGSVSSE